MSSKKFVSIQISTDADNSFMNLFFPRVNMLQAVFISCYFKPDKYTI